MKSSFGIVVGCDRNQEWLLPWWWDTYRLHNDAPVAFFDFGMSPQAAAWCKKRGTLHQASPICEVHRDKTPLELQKQWEKHFGIGIWEVRSAWIKKPLAFLHTPFSISLWIDIDCEVLTSLDPLFNLGRIGCSLALARDPLQWIFKKVPLYNSGVVLFQKGAPFISLWIEKIKADPYAEASDQDFLSTALHEHKIERFDLSGDWNWNHFRKNKKNALIIHHSGGLGKQTLFQKMVNAGYDLSYVFLPTEIKKSADHFVHRSLPSRR